MEYYLNKSSQGWRPLPPDEITTFPGVNRNITRDRSDFFFFGTKRFRDESEIQRSSFNTLQANAEPLACFRGGNCVLIINVVHARRRRGRE